LPALVPNEAHTVEAEDAAARGNALAIECCDECAAIFDLHSGFAWGIAATGTLIFICRTCWAVDRDRAALFLEWIEPEDAGAEAAAR
jgi:hypothetical protein